MEKTKQQIADVVRNAVRTAITEAFEDVELFKVTELETQIRMPGPNGPRYFIVQLREQY